MKKRLRNEIFGYYSKPLSIMAIGHSNENLDLETYDAIMRAQFFARAFLPYGETFDDVSDPKKEGSWCNRLCLLTEEYNEEFRKPNPDLGRFKEKAEELTMELVRILEE